MVEARLGTVGPAGRRQQLPAQIDVTHHPDQGVRPRRLVLGDDLSSIPGEILDHAAFDAYQPLGASPVCVRRENISARVRHLDEPVRAIIAILLLCPAVIDYGSRLIAGWVVNKAR